MILYFLLSILNSLAQSYHKRINKKKKHDEWCGNVRITKITIKTNTFYKQVVSTDEIKSVVFSHNWFDTSCMVINSCNIKALLSILIFWNLLSEPIQWKYSGHLLEMLFYVVVKKMVLITFCLGICNMQFQNTYCLFKIICSLVTYKWIHDEIIW